MQAVTKDATDNADSAGMRSSVLRQQEPVTLCPVNDTAGQLRRVFSGFQRP
jgi:hypothetical protein